MFKKKLLFVALTALAALCWACETDTVFSAEERAVQEDKLIQDYLKANKVDNAVRTSTGLYYQPLLAGSGKTASVGDSVFVKYTGWNMLSGEIFDSNIPSGKPFNVVIGKTGVIVGWTQALQLMRLGDSTRFYLPSGLAYGVTGSPPNIGSNQVLIFDIKMDSLFFND